MGHTVDLGKNEYPRGFYFDKDGLLRARAGGSPGGDHNSKMPLHLRAASVLAVVAILIATAGDIAAPAKRGDPPVIPVGLDAYQLSHPIQAWNPKTAPDAGGIGGGPAHGAWSEIRYTAYSFVL